MAVNSENDANTDQGATPCFREDSEGARGRYTHVHQSCAELQALDIARTERRLRLVPRPLASCPAGGSTPRRGA